MIASSSRYSPQLEAYIAAHYAFHSEASHRLMEKEIERLRLAFQESRETGEEAEGTPPAEAADAALGTAEGAPEESCDDFISRALEPHFFSVEMMALIHRKKLDPAMVYRKAGLDRRLFSKIRSRKEYKPAKKTILALCVGMELGMEETRELLETCGFTLSKKILSDVIVEFFIVNGKFDIMAVNEALASYGLPLLS